MLTLLWLQLACLNQEHRDPADDALDLDPHQESGDPGLHEPADDEDSSEGEDPGDSSEGEDPGDSSEGDHEDPQDAWVRLLSPGDGDSLENPVTFTAEGEGVDELRLSADGYEMATWSVEEGWSVSYSFSGTGYPRAVSLEGLDASGAVLASDAITITVLDDHSVLDVPYYYQYDNRYEPSATCGLTSAAMVLSYWLSGSRTPDELYEDYGKSQGQSPSGIEQIYGWEGLYGDYGLYGTRQQLKEQIDAGRPVVVHGYWTGSGHIAVIIGYDDEGWIVHDPAGDWEVCYGSGCSDGESVHYAFGGGWDDDLSWDGDIWWSAADTRAF